MLSENDWKRDPHIVDAYRELVLLMSKENDVPFDEVQGAVEYLLDAIKQCARSNRRQTVLVVDDELGIVEALELILSHACFDVVSAPNGHEALARLKDITPDVVILDLNMPILDGAGVLKTMREDAKNRRIPVILTSGLPEATVRRKCDGYNDFIRKPFKGEQLLEAISKFVSFPR
jgi:CheY-like chemotaxis protein